MKACRFVSWLESKRCRMGGRQNGEGGNAYRSARGQSVSFVAIFPNRPLSPFRACAQGFPRFLEHPLIGRGPRGGLRPASYRDLQFVCLFSRNRPDSALESLRARSGDFLISAATDKTCC